MNENFIISVTGTQIVDGEKDTIRLETAGEYIEKNGSRYIRYKEYDNDNPSICFDNTVKIDDNNMLTVIRSGPAKSRLTMEKGRRHLCHYATMFGDLMVGVYADTIENNLTPSGGTLFARYSLDFNAGLVSENEIYIKVTEKEGK